MNSTVVVYTSETEFTDTVQKALDQNLTEERKLIPVYYFQGGLNYEKMSFKSRTMIKMLASMMAKKKGQCLLQYDTMQIKTNCGL